MNYKNTPSFYNNEEYFLKYLGKTSYYVGLQDVVEKIIAIARPDSVLELGSALGTTTLRMAHRFINTQFEGTDLREDVVALANKAAKEYDNVNFFVGDMSEVVKGTLEKYDVIFMLYSFHHILDPLENKMEFLRFCFKNMKKGAYLLILETFLPEDVEDIEGDEKILHLWAQRSLEGYASTYWAALQDLTDDGISFAKRVASTSKSEESEAGNHVYRREDEYLIKLSWLEKSAKECGFNVVLAEPVNCIEEKVILLKK